jgi:predicted membrane protein
MKMENKQEDGQIDRVLKKNSTLAGKLFWGLLIIGIGVLLLLNAIFPEQDIPAVKIIGTVLLLAVSIASLTKFKYVLFFVPLALIAYIWRAAPQLAFMANVNIWLLLLAAVLLGVGLSIIFHRRSHIHVEINGTDSAGRTEEVLSENEQVDIDASWGDHIKYVHADNLKQARIKSSFASTKVYFDQCNVSAEGLNIAINGSFSEIVLNVPKEWEINNHISTFAGDVKSMSPMHLDNKIKVNLSGSINFAELRINYV